MTHSTCRQPICRASVLVTAMPTQIPRPRQNASCLSRLMIRALLPCLPALCALACSSTDLIVGAPTPAKCQVGVDNSLPTAPAAGAAGTLTVTTTPECEWEATTATSWIAITSPSHSQGSGAVTYRVAENADASARGGTVSINSTQVAINQAAGACRFTVAPLASSVAATGGSVEVRVDAQATCALGSGLSGELDPGWFQRESHWRWHRHPDDRSECRWLPQRLGGDRRPDDDRAAG